jgi:hypothetical protein
LRAATARFVRFFVVAGRAETFDAIPPASQPVARTAARTPPYAGPEMASCAARSRELPGIALVASKRPVAVQWWVSSM